MAALSLSFQLALGLLVADFGAMVNNPHLSDVQFQMDGGEVLYAHKFVLYARCPLLMQHVSVRSSCLPTPFPPPSSPSSPLLPSVPCLSLCLPAPFPPPTPALLPLPWSVLPLLPSRLCFHGEDRFEVRKLYEEMSFGKYQISCSVE